MEKEKDIELEEGDIELQEDNERYLNECAILSQKSLEKAWNSPEDNHWDSY